MLNTEKKKKDARLWLSEIEICNKLQELEKSKYDTRKLRKRARMQLKESDPDTPEGAKFKEELSRYYDEVAEWDRKIARYGKCSIWNCNKRTEHYHSIRNTRSETESCICTETNMDYTTHEGDNERATTRKKRQQRITFRWFLLASQLEGPIWRTN
ncbi:hypothetical protein AVEN_12281-1 [Araneus ventricosus]|uniref:Uncharacterized protein n=1 Tax=Araneus ventricosus TaxID=182803 RepID=A0A4Y2HCJ5_ARAVE|nr:hypothetical protein AVEN_12281-1 [Araneus ventricosus]